MVTLAVNYRAVEKGTEGRWMCFGYETGLTCLASPVYSGGGGSNEIIGTSSGDEATKELTFAIFDFQMTRESAVLYHKHNFYIMYFQLLILFDSRFVFACCIFFYFHATNIFDSP